MLIVCLMCLSFDGVTKTVTVNGSMLVHSKILAIEKSRINALIKKDWRTIESIMSEECIHITTDGSLRTKAQYMNKVKNSTSRFAMFKTKDINVRIYDDVVITTGHYENSKRINGATSAIKYGVFTRVYKKRHEMWLLVSHQATVNSI